MASRSIRRLLVVLIGWLSLNAAAQAQLRTEIDWLQSSVEGISEDINDFGFVPGLRFTSGYEMMHLDIEGSYTQINGWKETQSAQAFLFDIDASNSNMFRSYELNLGTRRSGQFWYAGVGARHVDFDDSTAISFGFLDLDGNPVGQPIRSGVSVANNLNGVQSVLGVVWDVFPLLQIEAQGKSGVYLNRVHSRATANFVDDEAGPVAFAFSNDERDVAFMTGGLLKATVPITTWFRVMAGYDVQFLTGVAQSADVLDDETPDDAPPTLRIHPNRSLLIHGAIAGIELAW